MEHWLDNYLAQLGARLAAALDRMQGVGRYVSQQTGLPTLPDQMAQYAHQQRANIEADLAAGRAPTTLPPAEVWTQSPMVMALGTSNIGKAADALKGASLPMDTASRMARARAMGFDVDAYHGTAENIKEFSNAHRGLATKARTAKMAHWFVDDPKTAETYANYAASDARVQKLIDASYAAERKNNWSQANKLMAEAEQLEAQLRKTPQSGQNILPVKLRGKMLEVDADGQTWSQLDENQIVDWLMEAKAKKLAGVKINRLVDDAYYGAGKPATHYAVFDPQNVRSKFADFDPIMSNSADLLAGIGMAGVVGGLGAMGMGGLIGSPQRDPVY